jgi:hypothetical protein
MGLDLAPHFEWAGRMPAWHWEGHPARYYSVHDSAAASSSLTQVSSLATGENTFVIRSCATRRQSFTGRTPALCARYLARARAYRSQKKLV